MIKEIIKDLWCVPAYLTSGDAFAMLGLGFFDNNLAMLYFCGRCFVGVIIDMVRHV
ncbi:hypothetical protein [Rhizobium sp. L245/93]|uniref:hypothetical protein n=1 Tax=Rhizobium sp. L245/93 TaxID=2819998 RepID=UPI001ADB612B|nr:hypothetical protein [Rhizobium sp. L245/93]MBO9170894.1 hypothetical protein [Rhizobium sp. L245/93]